MKEKDIKPCPFCGGKAKLVSSPRVLWPYVVCDNCNMSTWTYDTAEEAIEKWNMRHERTCTYDKGENYDLICSACGWNRKGALIYPNYCPHCGAKVLNANEENERFNAARKAK